MTTVTTNSKMEGRKPSRLMETVGAKNFCFKISLYLSIKSRDEISVRLRDVVVYYHFAISTFPVKIVIKSSAFILEYLLQLPISTDDIVQIKGKAIMEECKEDQVKKTKRQRMARVYKATHSVSNIDWDDVEAQIQADEDLAQRMLEEERETLYIAERARLLAEFIDKRKKIQAQQRYEAIKNKPPTRAQRRKYMTTYLQNQAN
ncbi:hypothetical protein Tco_1215145 [Tanacetum coccineum]